MQSLVILQQDFILSYTKVKFDTQEHSRHIFLSLVQRSAAAAAAAAAVADSPFRARASSLSGRTRKNQRKPRHLSAIYNSLVLVPLPTRATFIGDNERKRWDASLVLPSPPQRSFISPSHKADSPLVTPAAAMLEIDNKASGMKTGGRL